MEGAGDGENRTGTANLGDAETVEIRQTAETVSITICEIEVYDINNNKLALSSASQTSTAHSGVASRAIDGDTSGTYNDGSCTHTQPKAGKRQWWQVDLLQVYEISHIVITNRMDGCCGE